MTTRPLILGTAGHIDHGKTALVRALTGVDTDRLEEEKARGISIDIGFAHMELGDVQFGVVDVPGHERFIRNMLAGASGVDVAMLVIAADDSVMPQTREHLEILKLLGIRHGLVALTKIDLVEESWIDLVEEDIREFVTGTFLEDAPIVRISATTGAGLDELKRTLTGIGKAAPTTDVGEQFRLAVDRSFVVQGLGTVVTGTVWSGVCAPGDELDLLPEGKTVRVRGIQSHGSDAESVTRGQRAAINVMGAHHTDIERGCELATPGSLTPSKRLTVQLNVLPDCPWPIRHRARLRLHLGTQEVMASVALLTGTTIDPGQNAIAQLICAEPVLAVGAQPFVVRTESPLRTVGGGTVLMTNPARIRRRDAAAIERLGGLNSDDESQRAASLVSFYGVEPWTNADLARDLGVSVDRAAALIDSLRNEGVIQQLTEGAKGATRLHVDIAADLRARVMRAVERLHAAAPLEISIPRQRLVARVDYLPPSVVRPMIDSLCESGELQGDDKTVAKPKIAPKLTQAQRKLREVILEALLKGGFSPPDAAAIATAQGVAEAKVRPVFDLCVTEGKLVHIGGPLFLHVEHHEELKARLIDALSGSAGLSMSEIRQVLETSRKYAVPICEHLDRIGLTIRRGDVRVLKSPAATADTGQ